MLHLGFPDLTTDDSWAEEGLSTYAEPLARARVGLVREEGIWSDLVDGLPKGLPRRGDPGLHGTGDWGRTYWGGALFWLTADLRIREATRNRKGLPDALAAILAAGGDIRARWTLARALQTGDRALGLTVLTDLYGEQGTRAEAVDLDALWQRLGVQRRGGRVVFDDHAALATVRRAIDGSAERAAGTPQRAPAAAGWNLPASPGETSIAVVPSALRETMSANIEGNDSITSRPRAGPSTNPTFDSASASVASGPTTVTLSAAPQGCRVRGSSTWPKDRLPTRSEFAYWPEVEIDPAATSTTPRIRSGRPGSLMPTLHDVLPGGCPTTN